MKSIYNIYESILDDIDDQMNRGESDILLSFIFANNQKDRLKGFELLHNTVKTSKSKKINSTSKMKSSESYFVQFGRSIKVENGESTNKVIGPVHRLKILKNTGSEYKQVDINADANNQFGLTLFAFNLPLSQWRYIKNEFLPKAYDVYEISEDMEGLIDAIMKTTEKEMYKK